MPPLRKRLEDIPALLDYFVGRWGSEYNKLCHVSEPVVNKLISYSWPGNVRELENCVKRAILLCHSDVLLEEHIELPSETKESKLPEDRHEMIASISEKLEDIIPDILKFSNQNAHANIIDLVEEVIILRALKECDYNQVKTAKMLGISKNTLRHRMKKFNITPSGEDAPQ